MFQHNDSIAKVDRHGKFRGRPLEFGDNKATSWLLFILALSQPQSAFV